jgi:hypothetical protein
MIYPVITLYQPWAGWVVEGVKTIETRTHDRFKNLVGKTILIHSGQKYDLSAINNPYLTKESFISCNWSGYILGSAFVSEFSELRNEHSKAACIECNVTKRYGLFLTDIKKFPYPIKAKGQMGIWYFDVNTKQPCKKP